MDKQRQTAGETALRQAQGPANNNYPKRARLFSPDGHASKDIITIVSDEYVERFVRAHARRIGWRCSIRRVKVEAALRQAQGPQAENTWQKPAAIAERPQPKLYGAFDLALTPYRKEGGER